MSINVVKSDGRIEPLDKNKIKVVLDYACEGLHNVDPMQIYINANMKFYDGMTTADIHDSLIVSAHDLISELAPDYQIVAGRLKLVKVRKQAYGKFTPPNLGDHIRNMCASGKYHPEILEKWTQRDFDYFEKRINHDADLDLAYASMVQWSDKYLIQDRTTSRVYESPNMAIMLIAMCMFQEYPKSTRKQYVMKTYEAISGQYLSYPTPIMAGVRGLQKQYSSCVLIDVDDSLASINAASSAIVNYVSQKAGIGINAGRIRALGSPIRGGAAVHTGCIPFFKHFQSAVKSCSQGSIRNGASTLFYPFWHKDVESFVVLKNQKGTEDNRVRHIDYGIQLNRLFWKHAIKGWDIMLFCPNDVHDLYEAFFRSNEEFEELYDKYAKDPNIKKRCVNGTTLLNSIVAERASTGRIYTQHVDHCNVNGPFDPVKAPVKQSNLC